MAVVEDVVERAAELVVTGAALAVIGVIRTAEEESAAVARAMAGMRKRAWVSDMTVGPSDFAYEVSCRVRAGKVARPVGTGFTPR